jgi:hypothetical protein
MQSSGSRRPFRLPLLLLLAVPGLLGFDYGTPVIVRNEYDVYELQSSGEIDEEQRDVLLGLLSNPLDPNRASREDLQSLPDVTYGMADVIIKARQARPFSRTSQLRPIVGPTVWRQIKPFVEVPKAASEKGQAKGLASARMLEQLDDDTPVVAYLKGQVEYQKWLDAGVIVAEQQNTYGFDYNAAGTDDDPIRIEGFGPQVRLERAHVAVRRAGWSAIAGYYVVGFGQRLTFDDTTRERPHGWDDDLQIYEDTASYDSYSTGKHLLGVAGTVERPVGQGQTIDVTGWASSNSQDLYYSDLSPHEYVFAGLKSTKYPHFRGAYREDLVGLNGTCNWSQDAHVGATVWIGQASKAYDFDFTGTPIPDVSPYGAAGVDGAWSKGIFDLYGEGAVTYTGGFASRVESVLNPDNAEVSLAVRYYGTNWDNPHSRAPAESDVLTWDPDEYPDAEETGGKRDRDEFGPQFKAAWYPADWLRFRYKGDLWQRMAIDRWDDWMEGRIDIDPISQLGFDLWGARTDKDVTTSGPGLDYDADSDAERQGMKLDVALGVRLVPIDAVIVQTYYKESFQDSGELSPRYDRDHYWWAKATFDIGEKVEVAGRYKFYDYDVARTDDTTSYRSWYGQARVKLPYGVSLQGRYERVHYVTPGTDGVDLEQHLKAGLDLRF